MPTLLLGTTRRSAADPSPDGSVALFSYSQYSFKDESIKAGYEILDLATGKIDESGLNASEINEIVWLPGTSTGILYINATNEKSANDGSVLVAYLDAPYTGLKVANSSSGDLHFLLNCLAYPNGTAVNPESEVTPLHTGRLYSDNYVRHWDTWLDKNRFAVFAGILLANKSFELASTGMRNLNHEIFFTTTQSETPVQPFGDSSDYDVSSDGSLYAFLNKANYTASYIYVGSFTSSDVAVAINGPGSVADTAGHRGASSQPSFSADSRKLAYVQQDGVDYESDRLILYTVDVTFGQTGITAGEPKSLSAGFDRWVFGPLIWAADSSSIYATAEDYARVKVFNFPTNSDGVLVPLPLTSNTSVSSFSVLPDSSLFVTPTAIWTPTEYSIVSNGTKKTLFDASSVDQNLAGLGAHTVSEIFYNGSNPATQQQLHAMVVKPTYYVSNKTYPLAFIIHGGPQSYAGNEWSNRWNFQTWADQGYIVVAPNPTGSTSFGQQLIDSIQGQWGSWPYEDLVKAWEFIDENLNDVDTDTGIAAGASFGGYMINWIQSNALGKRFKALSTWASEELWFLRHDMKGSLWDPDAVGYRKWNPQNHIANWSTPHFVVHSSLDYRLPESDGLALFNILQARGVPSRFLSFADEGHWILQQQNSLFWHTEIFNWINHYAQSGVLDDVPIGN
ncbi:alpha/beta-hydrolase [Aureobasidium pullulans]|uniref:Dipeptidyl-peptidase V n=1 Tax=Aureobasidium pullulans TaxID=5580 RepID=A0A4S8ZW72_AURPU|nr:alpha/beta-hydrolase [Aureobasidium pullulans]